MRNLVESIQKLPPELQQEVEDFIQCRNQKEFNHEEPSVARRKTYKKISFYKVIL
jgi:hypothetical protein